MSLRRPRLHFVISQLLRLEKNPPPHFLPREGRWAYIHESGVDVVAALPVDGDEERQAAVRRQDVHAPVFLMVPGQKRDATVFHTQCRRDHVQGLCDRMQTVEKMLDSTLS